MPRHSPGLGFADNGWVCVSADRPVNSDRRILTGVPSGTGETTSHKGGYTQTLREEGHCPGEGCNIPSPK